MNKWKHIPTNFECKTRKEMKDYMGGVSRFNAAFKYGDIIIINYDYIAANESIYTNTTKPIRA